MARKKTKKKSKRKTKRKNLPVNFKNKLVVGFLILITFLLIFLLFTGLILIFLQFKDLAKAATIQRPVYIVDSQPIDIDAYLREYFVNKVPQKTIYVNVSAYTSTKNQTDGSPYVTAVGTPVRDGIVAANFLPIGTVVRIPDKFGDKLFVVEDRMNERFSFQVDVWMADHGEAKKFGMQFLKLEIF